MRISRQPQRIESALPEQAGRTAVKKQLGRTSTISAATPLWIAARQMLKIHGKEFFKRWSKVVKSYDVEEIHDLRVASRRLREALALFEPCFAEKSMSRLSRKVKRVTGVLGDLRNTDEAIIFFSRLSAEEQQQSESELKELLSALEKERAAARKQLHADLERLQPGPLRSALKEELAALQLFGSTRIDPLQDLSSFANSAIAARELPLAGLLPRALDEADASAQHRLRIAVKRMRYRLEILEPLFGPEFSELHATLKGYQELLGKLHDLDVFAGMLLERLPEGAGRQGLMQAITARRSAQFAAFLAMLKTVPVDMIGARARRAF